MEGKKRPRDLYAEVIADLGRNIPPTAIAPHSRRYQPTASRLASSLTR